MRKLVVGVGILAIFGIYSVGIRHISPVIGKPLALKSSSKSSTPSSTSSGGSSGGSTPPPSASSTGQYKDGTYTSAVENAYYGNVQIQITIASGKLTNVKFLQYPNSHTTSVIINQQVMPYLKQEAIKAQSANVQLITGATFTSQAFQREFTT